MEPQEQKIYCYCNKDCKKKSCIGIAVAIFFVAFAFTIGTIIGASLSTAVLDALAAVIVLAVVLFILFVVALILQYCKRRC
jgi:Mn2+/Fe2+ NRAMP family transporter